MAKRLAVFQLDAGRTVLSILTRDGLRPLGEQRCHWVSSISTRDGRMTIAGSRFSDPIPLSSTTMSQSFPRTGENRETSHEVTH